MFDPYPKINGLLLNNSCLLEAPHKPVLSEAYFRTPIDLQLAISKYATRDVSSNDFEYKTLISQSYRFDLANLLNNTSSNAQIAVELTAQPPAFEDHTKDLNGLLAYLPEKTEALLDDYTTFVRSCRSYDSRRTWPRTETIHWWNLTRRDSSFIFEFDTLKKKLIQNEKPKSASRSSRLTRTPEILSSGNLDLGKYTFARDPVLTKIVDKTWFFPQGERRFNCLLIGLIDFEHSIGNYSLDATLLAKVDNTVIEQKQLKKPLVYSTLYLVVDYYDLSSKCQQSLSTRVTKRSKRD